ncbi:MAG: hypothetical protein WC415_02175 [Patescibacteria group bacterium]|jgi:hypothetical protein
MISIKKCLNFLPILFYWVVFFIVLFFAIFLGKNGYSDNFDFSGYLGVYLLFIHPFLFFIPFRLIRVEKMIGKIISILTFLVIPYIIIYIYVFFGLLNSFGHITW